jgi:hypothetical protein
MIYFQKMDNRVASRAVTGSNEIKALIDDSLFGGSRRRKASKLPNTLGGFLAFRNRAPFAFRRERRIARHRA